MHQKVQTVWFEDRLKAGAKKWRHQEFVEVSEQLGRRSWLNCELENPAGEAGLAQRGEGVPPNKSKLWQVAEAILEQSSKELWFLWGVSMNRRPMLETEMYFQNWHTCWLESSFHLAGEPEYTVTSLHPPSLYKSGMGSDGEIHSISFAAAFQGEALLFKASDVSLLLSIDANFYRYHLMASEDLRVWLGITIIPGSRQWNCSFTSQCSEQKHLSKATKSWWMQVAGSPWGSFILTPVTDVCSCWGSSPKLASWPPFI